ncbi:4'-phosphopantetheinyl transferase superfamily protein [Hyphomonas sp.]|uniref:4'-phosphopantetheinyl transferase family protein n=1 Tax=Hyphomonas sp. TaxID=87 RepID=UPI001BCC3BE9|nr:4'-phosphopantetheinyl transferase superfamily protein [Hyphomonas sp.]
MTEAGELPVNIWVWDLDISQQQARHLAECLSEDEIRRADRFATAELRRRWIAGRAGMRNILASSLGVPASRLVFEAGPHGRPSLCGPDCPFSFNLSHSASLAAFAICSAPVGIDVEEIKALPEGVAKMMFSAPEVAALEAEPEDKQAQAFFRYWTAKEAILKARGTGLSVSGRSFTIDIAQPDVPRLVTTDWEDGDASPWRLLAFDPRPGFAGAVAVRTPRPLRLDFQPWPVGV